MRGGFGQAGRYRHKRSRLIRTKEFFEMRYVGKKGFNSITQKNRKFQERSMNLIQLIGLVEKLTSEKKLHLEADVPTVDLREFGYTKLLGAGNVSKPIRVKVEKCSESALRKLKDAGGDAILNKPSET
jgi:large subunit ribosomal protein L15